MAPTLREYYNTGDNSWTNARAAEWRGQTFTVGTVGASENFNITTIEVLAFRTGTGGGTCNVEIYATSAGLPTGSAISSGSFAAGDLTTSTSGEWKEVTMSSVTLDDATKYALVLSVPTGDGSNAVSWRYDSTSPTYAGGAFVGSANSGSSWSETAGTDFMFEIWGETVALDIVETDSVSISDSLSLTRELIKSFSDNATLTDSLTISTAFNKIFSDITGLSDTLAISVSKALTVITSDITTLDDTSELSVITPKPTPIRTKVEIASVEYTDINNTRIERTSGDFNTTSSFVLKLDNFVGKYKTTFNLNDQVDIYANQTTGEATTKIFSGVIENRRFDGKPNKERIILSGRDFGATLQDVIVSPRIFKDTEASEIVNTLMVQNITSDITTNNVNVTTTNIEKITFNNISVFDAIKQIAELSGFVFYVDANKDLHFEEQNSISSGYSFNNRNVLTGTFRTSDDDIFNKVTVIGDRQLTGARQEFITGTDNTGSVYKIDAKPFNTTVTTSGATNTILQPGGILNINDPFSDDVKYLVNHQGREIILTSGTTAGDNILATGSVLIIDYQRSTPLITIKDDPTSIATFGQKDKQVIDRNIKDLNEANIKANQILADHKDPKTEGTLDIHGILDVVPGTTALINLPYHNQLNQTYSIMNATYEFNKINNLSNRVLTVKLNKKINNFLDTIKNQELRLRALEGAEVDSSVTNVELATGSIGISGTSLAIRRSIGSAFYFHVTNHNVLSSPSSLLGDMRAGSIVFQDGIQI